MKEGIFEKIALMNPWLVFGLMWVSSLFWLIAALNEAGPYEHLFVGLYIVTHFGFWLIWPISVLNVLSSKTGTNKNVNVRKYNILALCAVICTSIILGILGKRDPSAPPAFTEILFSWVFIFLILRIFYRTSVILVELEKDKSINENGRFSTMFEILYFPLFAYHIRRRLLALDNPELRPVAKLGIHPEPFVPMTGGIYPEIRARLDNAKARRNKTRRK